MVRFDRSLEIEYALFKWGPDLNRPGNFHVYLMPPGRALSYLQLMIRKACPNFDLAEIEAF